MTSEEQRNAINHELNNVSSKLVSIRKNVLDPDSFSDSILNALSSTMDRLERIRDYVEENTDIFLNTSAPKGVFSSSPRFILIDDDSLNRDTWSESARLKEIPFMAFSSFQELQENLHILAPDPHFFIDYNLGENTKNGVEVAGYLFAKGYKYLHLATGSISISRKNLPAYITCVRDKLAPWLESDFYKKHNMEQIK